MRQPGERTLAGTATLLQVALRRDRLQLAAWVGGLSAFVGFAAFSLRDQFDDASARASRATLMSSPTLRSLRGPGYGLDDYTVPVMVAHELLLFGLIGVALMAIFMVTRHLRAVEEDGRWELVGAAMFGRHAGVAAAGVIASVAAAATGAATAAVLLATGGGEMTTRAAVAFGGAMALTGIVFAAIGLLASQLATYSRGANAIGLVALGAAFVLRAIGDRGGPDDRALSWLSPLGWAQSVRPGADGLLWPTALVAVTTVALTAIAATLASRRDLGAGIISPRPGPTNADPQLVNPAGFAWRLQRTATIGWMVGAAAVAAPFGAVIGDIDEFLGQNPQLAGIFGAGDDGLLAGFLDTVLTIVGLLAASAAVQAVLRLRTEEQTGRAELYLSTPISRGHWMRTHLGWSLVTGSTTLLAGATGLSVAAALDQRDPGLVADITRDGTALLPAVWLFALIAATIWRFVPRFAPTCWLLVAHATFVEVLGDALELPSPVRALSPFHHVG
jgi:ABC-2 type transport system permease protein